MPKKPKGKAKPVDTQVGSVLSKKLKRKLKKEQMRGSKQQDDEEEVEEEEEEVIEKPLKKQKSQTPSNNAPVPQKAKGKPQKASSKGGCEVCLEGHPLHLFRTPHDEYVCDACDSGEFLPFRTVMFGCRLCDWDACDQCVSEAVKERELQLEASADKPQKKKGKISKEGSWKMLRGSDKYKNEYMYLRHEGSGVCVELPNYSLAQFEYRPGAGARSMCCSAEGTVEPFQLTLPHLEEKLAQGGGKAVPEKKNAVLGNWEVVGLGDGSAVATNSAHFIKTTKHKEGDGAVEGVPEGGEGLEVHFMPTGQVVWVCGDKEGARALLIEPHAPPQSMTRAEALKLVGAEEDGEEEEEED